MARHTHTHTHICPVGLSRTLDNPLRSFFQNPEIILKPYISKGMTVLDLGCGPGFFSTGIAKLVSDSGKVIAADIQDEMLEKLTGKIIGTEYEKRIEIHHCDDDKIGISQKVDFVMAFWMVHEVPDQKRLLQELKSFLKPSGKIFISEPKFHVSAKAFDEMINTGISIGLTITGRPKVFFSRSVILE